MKSYSLQVLQANLAERERWYKVGYKVGQILLKSKLSKKDRAQLKTSMNVIEHYISDLKTNIKKLK
jgi:chaperonin cofactor prefoldin